MLDVLRYYTVFAFVPLAVWSMRVGGPWTFSLPLVAFGVVPLLELLVGGSTQNLSPETESRIAKSRVYDLVVYLVVPTQLAVLWLFLGRMSAGGLAPLERVGMVATMGVLCGVFGINVAHELGHRKRRYEQWMAQTLLATSLYMHFFIEHNRGHHKRIATEEDPASARFGETLYGFWFRSAVFGYLSAWQLERERLTRAGRGWLSPRNQMLRFQLIQAALVGGVAWRFGLVATGCFVVAAALGALLLETVNYIEHYGLTRKRTDAGRYEHVAPHHSWNSDHSLGRLLLFELTRHSDHHANAARRYQILRHWDEAPQMPTGYPGMMVLATLPPLWFRVMHPRLKAAAPAAAAAA